MAQGLLDFLVIRRNSTFYNIFTVFITILKLVSFYLYGYLAAFRMHPQMNYIAITYYVVFEIIFVFDLIINFFVEIIDEETNQPERDLKKIAINYLNGLFFIDFITLIPLQLIPIKNNRNYLFFLIKMLRLVQGLRIFNVSVIMKRLNDNV